MSCENCRAIAEENNRLAEENAGLHRMCNHAARSEQAMRQELMRSREEEPGSEDVLELLHLWRDEVMGGSQRVIIKMGGPRANRVRWALKHASKHGGKELLVESIMGCTLDDWAMGRDPRTNGRRSNDIADHIFKSEASIEKYARIWRNHQKNAAGGGIHTPRAYAKGLDDLPTEEQLAEFAKALLEHDVLLSRLKAAKSWEPDVLERLGVGWDGSRVLFPIRDEHGVLLNVVQYGSKLRPKSLALRGRPRGLFPAPETVQGDSVWLLEGEPDAVSAHGIGLPGVGVPGTNGWRPEWAARLNGRAVVVCFDADEVGRKAAAALAETLTGHVSSVRVVELDETLTNGYDLTDAIKSGANRDVLLAMASEAPAVYRLRNAA